MNAGINMPEKPWAVITGASSGIGLEFTRELARRGYSIVAVSNQEAELEDTARDLEAAYGDVRVLTACIDLSLSNAVDNVCRILDGRGIIPEVLVNNAGIFDFRRVDDLTPRRRAMYIDLHMCAVTELCVAIGRRMADAGRGYILNMSSMSCWMPMPGIALYSATKAYIRAFSRAYRVEMKDSGVSVTVACPGGIATSLFGLPERWLRFATRIGVLAPPGLFVRRALRRMFHRRAQYVNGLLNRISIVFVALLPEAVRRQIAIRIPVPE